jgi:anaerobic selenocysteine-containing dehydrogenase
LVGEYASAGCWLGEYASACGWVIVLGEFVFKMFAVAVFFQNPARPGGSAASPTKCTRCSCGCAHRAKRPRLRKRWMRSLIASNTTHDAHKQSLRMGRGEGEREGKEEREAPAPLARVALCYITTHPFRLTRPHSRTHRPNENLCICPLFKVALGP